jgi:hypothetical protein
MTEYDPAAKSNRKTQRIDSGANSGNGGDASANDHGLASSISYGFEVLE